ncbi:hypothetical protein [Exiguobacterium sp.]|uniref:hypothetical protein n=1 Tax=Exiguobacterium sp. TaxID=44751 RepID=UPI00263B8B4A|nr:hypothetical protein [Exiguobacterium sp.]MCC5892923.1 hypothetical protein [Exiguobacterium sp.]
MLDILFLLSGTALAISFLLHSATKGEIKKDNELQRVPTKKMLKMRKVTGQMMGVSGAILFFAFAINLSSPAQDIGTSEATTVEATETESDHQEEQAKLGPYSVAAIPNNVPPSYIMQYKELADIISRADATLRLIKNTINKCEAPCPKPLSEIEQQFLLLSDVIDKTRNELFRGSEIARVMAEENPQGLDALKLYELQQDLISTEYSLETMQLADSWESWEEPIEYAESTRTKRLYKIKLGETVLPIESTSTSKASEEKETSDQDFEISENGNIFVGKPFNHQQLYELNVSNEITVDSAIDMTYEMIGNIYVCAKLCKDYPVSDVQLNLSFIKEDTLNIIESLKTMSDLMYILSDSNTPNIDPKEAIRIAEQLSIAEERMNILLTKNDWANWDEPGNYAHDLISYLETLRGNLAF